eukprot:EG_transcript_22195
MAAVVLVVPEFAEGDLQTTEGQVKMKPTNSMLDGLDQVTLDDGISDCVSVSSLNTTCQKIRYVHSPYTFDGFCEATPFGTPSSRDTWSSPMSPRSSFSLVSSSSSFCSDAGAAAPIAVTKQITAQVIPTNKPEPAPRRVRPHSLSRLDARQEIKRAILSGIAPQVSIQRSGVAALHGRMGRTSVVVVELQR